MNSHIFVNPVHGNEPYILGTLIANDLSLRLREKREDIMVIVPNIYGQRQEKILVEHGLKSNIVLDKRLGEFYKPILFKDGDFRRHIDDLIEERDEVESRIRSYLKQEYGKIDLEINAGSRIVSEAEAYYVFPALLSQILEHTINEKELSVFDGEKLQKCLNNIKKVEAVYKKIFIPSFHTFSFEEYKQTLPNQIFTPPLKSVPHKNVKEIPRNSVYCMLSGTGSELDSMYGRAAVLQDEGYTVIVPPWAQTDKFTKETPDIISNKNIVKVIARAGWGTMWTSQQAGKDFEPIPYTQGDDPEIYFNIKTLDSQSLGEATNIQRRNFHGNMDGISFVVDKIMEDLE